MVTTATGPAASTAMSRSEGERSESRSDSAGGGAPAHS